MPVELVFAAMPRELLANCLIVQSPIGNWPKDPEMKEMGEVQQMAFLADIEGYVMLMSATVGWSREQTIVFVAQMRREMRSGEYHPLFKQKIVWGQKPYSSEG